MSKYKPSFYTVDSFGEKSLLTNLENNMKAFLNWGFLNIGAYVNVDIPTNNIHNFGQHILKPAHDPTRPARTVWQTPKKDWVYEQGVCYKEHSPNSFGGVYVDGTFYPGPTGSGDITYNVDYPNGQIIFDKPIPTNAEVMASYSYKSVQVYNSDEFPGWKEVQFDSNINTDSHFNKYKTGDSAVHPEHRVQLPAVVIEIDSRESSTPFRLGDRSLIIKQDVLFHIVTDNKQDKHKIVDILRLQKDRYIWLFDTNKVIEDKKYELNLNGSLNPNSINYDELTNTQKYRWKMSRISDIQVSDMVFYHMNLFGSTVRMTHEFIQNDFVPTCFDDSTSVSASESTDSGSSSSDSQTVSVSDSSVGSEPTSLSSGSSVSVSSTDETSSTSRETTDSSGSSQTTSVSSGSSASIAICYSNVLSVELECSNLCYSNNISVLLNCLNMCYSAEKSVLLTC